MLRNATIAALLATGTTVGGITAFQSAVVSKTGSATPSACSSAAAGDICAADDMTAGDDIAVTDDASVGGDLSVTGTSGAADLDASDDLTVDDDALVSGTLTTVEQTIGIPLTQARVFDALNTLIPNTAAADDAGLVGTVGTNGMSIQTADEGGTGSEQHHYFAFSWIVPSSYVAGSTIKLSLTGGMLRVADQAPTTVVDVTAFVNDYANADLTISGDLCGTAAITAINSATFADHLFTIDDDAAGYVLTAGDEVWFTVRMTVDDNGNAGADITMVIEQIKILISA